MKIPPNAVETVFASLPCHGLLFSIVSACLFALRVQAADAPAPPAKLEGRPQAAEAKHLLRAGDAIDVQVFGEEDLHVKGQLDPSGSIGFALIGKVKLKGQTAEQAARTIRELYMQDYLVDPLVSVQVVEFSKNRFTILGQVQAPGVYTYAVSEKINMLQAIAKAGGYTRIGQPKKIVVKRTVHDKETIIRLNAKAMANKAGQEIFEIQPEDTITVGETVF